jgi:hypothetical protein
LVDGSKIFPTTSGTGRGQVWASHSFSDAGPACAAGEAAIAATAVADAMSVSVVVFMAQRLPVTPWRILGWERPRIHQASLQMLIPPPGQTISYDKDPT